MLLIVCLGGCSGIALLNPGSIKLDKAYEFTASIQHGELNTLAQFSRRNADNWEISLLEPFAVEGVTLSYENGSFTALYDNAASNPAANGDAVYQLMIDAFENAINGEGREIVSGKAPSKGQIKVTSKAGSPAKSYELVLDKKSLEPLKLKIPEAGITAEFSEVRVSQVVSVIN